MRQLLSFVGKEFRHILRDRWTTLILLCLPVIMLVLFGFAISTEVKNTGLAIYDPSNDRMTQAIVQRLAASEYFHVVKVLHDPDSLDEVFRTGEAGLVVVFGEHFHEKLVHSGKAGIQLISDASDPNTARTVTNYATQIISSFQQELAAGAKSQYRIIPEIKLLYNPSMKGAYNFVPGVLGMILMLICAMMTSVSIAREKELGTMEVLLVSPVRPLTIVLAKVVPYFVLSILDFVIICVISVYVLEVPIAGSLFWLTAVSMIYIALALALGILISSIVSTQLVALLISGMAMIVPVIFLSGMMFPVETMPVPLQILSRVLPASWYITAVRKLMIMGLEFGAIRTELAVLGGMTLFLTVMALKKHKARLE